MYDKLSTKRYKYKRSHSASMSTVLIDYIANSNDSKHLNGGKSALKRQDVNGESIISFLL